jgi:hypothetical protein
MLRQPAELTLHVWRYATVFSKTVDPVKAMRYRDCAELQAGVQAAMQLNERISNRAHPVLEVASEKTGKKYTSGYTSASIHFGSDHMHRDLSWLPGCTIAHGSCDIFEMLHQKSRWISSAATARRGHIKNQGPAYFEFAKRYAAWNRVSVKYEFGKANSKSKAALAKADNPNSAENTVAWAARTCFEAAETVMTRCTEPPHLGATIERDEVSGVCEVVLSPDSCVWRSLGEWATGPDACKAWPTDFPADATAPPRVSPRCLLSADVKERQAALGETPAQSDFQPAQQQEVDEAGQFFEDEHGRPDTGESEWSTARPSHSHEAEDREPLDE